MREAGDLGFEPRHTDPESAVLPLDESPASPRIAGGAALYPVTLPKSRIDSPSAAARVAFITRNCLCRSHSACHMASVLR